MPNSNVKTIDYRTLVAQTEGEDYPQVVHDAYEFARKTFKEDDKAGVYNDNPN